MNFSSWEFWVCVFARDTLCRKGLRYILVSFKKMLHVKGIYKVFPFCRKSHEICNKFHKSLSFNLKSSLSFISIQSVSVMMQNINRGNRGTHMEYKWVYQRWPYLNRFQVTANRIKKWKILQKPSFLKYRKMLHKNEVHI